jgi:hypothetical protein
MSIIPGWCVTKDRMKDFLHFRARRFGPFETPILTTVMKRSKSGKGFAVLTNKHFFYRRRASAALDALSTFSTATADTGWEDFIPLEHIVNMDYQGKGLYLLKWLKVNRHGEPKRNRHGDYKTQHAKFRVLKNKGEEQFKYLERREQFGYFLQKAIDEYKEQKI